MRESMECALIGVLMLALLAGCAGRRAGGTAVRREGGKVWVTGVPDVKMTEHMRLRGMEILLRHRGEKVTLDDLLVYSGKAFHLCHGTKWELRTGLNMPSNPWDNLAQAYGYGSRWTTPNWFHAMQRMPADQRKQKTDAFLGELWKSADAGRPALLGGAYGECGTWRVVVGYDRKNEKVCYVGGEKAYEWVDLIDDKVKKLGFWDMQVQGPVDPQRRFTCGTWLANTAFLLGEKKRNPSERDKAVAALKLVRGKFYVRPSRAYGVTYHFGNDAYRALAKDLHELDYPADVKKRPKSPEIYDMSQLWGQVNSIIVGRAAAARFCERAATLLPQAKRPLVRAAALYREEVALAKSAFGPFAGGHDETRKAREAWLADEKSREAGAAAIDDMLRREQLAYSLLMVAFEASDNPKAGGTEGNAMEMKGLKTVVVAEDNLQMGCMRSCLNHLNANISTPWLAGMTGHAFVISITKGFCPSTPWNSLFDYYESGRMTELCRNAGVVLEHHAADSDDPDVAAKKKAAFAECRKAIRQGIPCFAYHNFHYQMLARCDEAGFYTVKGRGPIDPDKRGGFEVCIVRPCKPADDKAALKAALQFALAYAAADEKRGGVADYNAHGSNAYDRWISYIGKGEPGSTWRWTSRAIRRWSGSGSRSAPGRPEAGRDGRSAISGGSRTGETRS